MKYNKIQSIMKKIYIEKFDIKDAVIKKKAWKSSWFYLENKNNSLNKTRSV
jgi:hypothetical protein